MYYHSFLAILNHSNTLGSDDSGAWYIVYVYKDSVLVVLIHEWTSTSRPQPNETQPDWPLTHTRTR